jgi:hypothetical protein
MSCQKLISDSPLKDKFNVKSEVRSVNILFSVSLKFTALSYTLNRLFYPKWFYNIKNWTFGKQWFVGFCKSSKCWQHQNYLIGDSNNETLLNSWWLIFFLWLWCLFESSHCHWQWTLDSFFSMLWGSFFQVFPSTYYSFSLVPCKRSSMKSILSSPANKSSNHPSAFISEQEWS